MTPAAAARVRGRTREVAASKTTVRSRTEK
jgi:hypothetical protein